MHFSFGEKHVLQNTRFLQHAFLVDLLGVLFVFRIFKMPCSLDPQKAAQTVKKGPFGRCPFFELGPKISQRSPFRVLEGAQWARASQPPCMSPLHLSAEESVQSADEEGVVLEAGVTAKILPVQDNVKCITAGKLEQLESQ